MDDVKNNGRVMVSNRRRWRLSIGVVLLVVVETVWNASTTITITASLRRLVVLYRILLEPLVDSSSTARSAAAVVERYTIICVQGELSRERLS